MIVSVEKTLQWFVFLLLFAISTLLAYFENRIVKYKVLPGLYILDFISLLLASAVLIQFKLSTKSKKFFPKVLSHSIAKYLESLNPKSKWVLYSLAAFFLTGLFRAL